mgnify:CR=1 FL=1
MKKSTPSSKSLLIIISLLLSGMLVKAQFEQKLTFQGALGYIHALSPDYFVEVFEFGGSLDAGLQYNFNRSTSLVVLIKYATFVSNDETFFMDAYYNLIGISLCPKYKFIPHRRLNPYIYGGASLNYSSFSFGSGMQYYETPWEAQFGFNGGFGLDFRITDNFALFWQTGVNGVFYPDDMIFSRYSQLGINISMFKARAL